MTLNEALKDKINLQKRPPEVEHLEKLQADVPK